MSTALWNRSSEPDAAPLAERGYNSIVTPCFNQSVVQFEFRSRTDQACEQLNRSAELTLGNNGSTDDAWKQMKAICACDLHVTAIDLSHNHGQHSATCAGLSVRRGRRIETIEADLQDRPELIGPMSAVVDQGSDVLYGQLRTRAGETTLKPWTASLFHQLLAGLTDKLIPRNTGDVRQLTRRVLELHLRMPERHRFIRGMINWVGFSKTPFFYDRDARYAGVTSFPYRRLLKVVIDEITSSAMKPLLLSAYLGIFVGAASLLLGVDAVAERLLTGVVPLLFVLGIIGEYLGRLDEQSKDRPLFMIREILNPAESTPAGGATDFSAQLRARVPSADRYESSAYDEALRFVAVPTDALSDRTRSPCSLAYVSSYPRSSSRRPSRSRRWRSPGNTTTV